MKCINTVRGPPRDRMLVSKFCTAGLPSDKSDLSCKIHETSSKSDCLIRHGLISEFGAAYTPSYR